ncbi:MAG: NADPH:quinone reductase, partial [Nocardioidaceae bacterium]|nr:NADPH:quinone reductase [Nocardioidaceae bacterium]
WGDRDAAPGPDFEILGDHRPGTYAELVSVPAECVLPRPPGLGLAQAAAFSLVGVTTYRALFSRGRLTAGESLLELGASGGVDTAAVALGSSVGARVVVTSSSPAKIDGAVTMGAVSGVDHGADDWVEQARALTPDGFDVVLDSVGRWPESVRCLRPGGRLVVLGASVATEAALDVRRFYFGQYELIGTTMGSPRDMAGLLAFVAEHLVPPPVIDRTYPHEQAADAHRRLESGEGVG